MGIGEMGMDEDRMTTGKYTITTRKYTKDEIISGLQSALVFYAYPDSFGISDDLSKDDCSARYLQKGERARNALNQFNEKTTVFYDNKAYDVPKAYIKDEPKLPAPFEVGDIVRLSGGTCDPLRVLMSVRSVVGDKVTCNWFDKDLHRHENAFLVGQLVKCYNSDKDQAKRKAEKASESTNTKCEVITLDYQINLH